MFNPSGLVTLTIVLLAATFSLTTAQAKQDTAPALPELNRQIPQEVETTGRWAGNRQMQVNRHAWRTFSGLMWPASPRHRGKPRLTGNHNHHSLRVWETWKEQYEVYPLDGSKPANWNAAQPVPAACHSNNGEALKYLYRDEKVDDVLDAVNQAVKADGTLPGTLTDQNNHVVRYEIRLNETLFNYIVEHKLYNGIEQAKANTINFPNGSMLIKAAWKELPATTPKHQRKQFLTRNACICDTDEAGASQCHKAKAALVGFHVMQKTPSAPQWLWSTFEHDANVRPSHGVPASFHNPDCKAEGGQYCNDNSQTPTGIANQVTQLLPIPADLQDLNRRVQHWFGLFNSVLRRYQLMSAQWPIQTAQSAQHPTVFDVQPEFSANTTMETFAQETSSCMGCHVMSRTMRPDEFVSADFSFTLNNAHPQPPGSICGEFSYSNSISCSNQLILFDPDSLQSYSSAQKTLIRRGYQLVTETYEQLPNNVGNRLHCSSCHLHAGGAPDAAWWVGMQKKYVTKEKLEERINGCFKRSMDGTPLCDPENAAGTNHCDNNTEMSAITTYMGWVTDTYNKKHSCGVDDARPECNPQHGFPPLVENPAHEPLGNAQQGQAIFNQKCAFCHNDQGQGRYASHTYFRPALWGPSSYRIESGLGKNAQTLASFLRWNMPYGSGGLLTAQEAQDIACFIDGQIRPGKTTQGAKTDSVCLPDAFVAKP